jgi:hypothetical protein
MPMEKVAVLKRMLPELSPWQNGFDLVVHPGY